MNLSAKGFAFLISFSLLGSFGASASAQHSGLSISYLGGPLITGRTSYYCKYSGEQCYTSFSEDIYSSTLPSPNLPIKGIGFNSFFYDGIDSFNQYGSIIVSKQGKETKAPIHIDYSDLDLGEFDTPQARAIISFFHPSLIAAANKDVNEEVEVNDYLIGDSKFSETLHLFKPERHKLSSHESNILKTVINQEFVTIDLGESYSMIMVFDKDHLPSSIYVLDRWKLFRQPLVKTVIGYGDLFGLVLHVMDFAGHAGSLIGLGGDGHDHGPKLSSSSTAVLGHLISAGFHFAEIADHTQGVAEFLYGGQKYYEDHDHGFWEDIFGVMHLAHTFYETYSTPSLLHYTQVVLTVASFGYHHVPSRVFEYSLLEALQASARSNTNRVF